METTGRRTSYSYDFNTTNVGDLLSVTRLYNTPTPITTTFTYTSTFHQLKSIQDPLNHTTYFLPFQPDNNGSIQTFQDAVGNTITFTYNAAGQVQTAADSATPPDTTTFTYSSAGDLTAVQDPNGNTTKAGYDGAGRLNSATDPLRNTTSYLLDGVGHVTQITDAKNGLTKFSYDDVGNLLKVTDANTHTVATNTYDLRNRLKTACDAVSRCASYDSYDADDNLTQSHGPTPPGVT